MLSFMECFILFIDHQQLLLLNHVTYIIIMNEIVRILATDDCTLPFPDGIETVLIQNIWNAKNGYLEGPILTLKRSFWQTA